jgi:hypothetical protein
VIRDPVLDTQAAEPAVRQVHLHLAADRPLRADREHIAKDEHPKHEHRIDRRTAHHGVMRRELGVDPGKIQNRRDLSDAVIDRNHIIEAERIEKLPLILLKPPHHRRHRR